MNFGIRQKVIDLLKKGKKQSDIAKLLNIDKSTIYRWNKRYKTEGNCKFKGYNNNQDKKKIKNINKFKKIIDENHSFTLEEFSVSIGNVKREAVRLMIKKLGYSYKKNSGYILKEMKSKDKNIIKN
jgi:transposase